MSNAPKPKRGPTVLVTDARDAPPPNRRPGMLQRQSTRLISVDNVLQYASEIPSGQRRGPPSTSRPGQPRTPSGRALPDPKLAGRMVKQQLPSRSSKVTEKLVLLPEADVLDEDEKGEFGEDDFEAGPPRDDDLERWKRLPKSMKEKSYAERLPKASRAEKLSRVTAYCTAQGYKMRATAEFVRNRHGAKTKLYDDCLYTVYHLPLLSGVEGFRIRSSPVLKSPGGKAVLDEEIERNERHEYREGFFGEEQFSIRSGPDDHERRLRQSQNDGTPSPGDSPREMSTMDLIHDDQQTDGPDVDFTRPGTGSGSNRSSSPVPAAHQLSQSLSTFAEVFIYSYGVVVFWNFTERQEKDILADLTFSSTFSPSTTKEIPHGIPLAIRPQSEEDFETEEFHFEYNPEIPRPRIFNDMITLRSGDHMIKLAMSHAIAQSTKLSFFEERMAETMEEAKAVPKRLAIQGELGMKREEVVRILGKLFKSRVDVNLSSNMLDVPNFFWESEPTLNPLYTAVREYLEIKPRIQVLNERCRVFLDLAEILSDSIADRKMSQITWIIIVLIVLSILVTTSEVFLRFGILSSSGKGPKPGAEYVGLPPVATQLRVGEL